MKDMRWWSVAGVSAVFLAVGGAPLMAQDYSGAFTIGYGSASVSSDFIPPGESIDMTELTAHGDLSVQFPDGFRLGARFYHISPDIDISGFPPSPNLQVRGSELNFGYTMPSGAWFAVYAEEFDVNVNDEPLLSLISIGQHYYGIEGGTTYGGVDVSAFVGKGNDVTSYGVAAQYATNQFVVGGNYMHSDIAIFPGSPSVDADLDNYGIAGAYQINPQFGVFAGAGMTKGTISIAPGDDATITAYGIGVSYDMSSFVNLPMIVSVEYAGTQLDVSGTDVGTVDGFRLGLTMPLGSSTRSINVPGNSVAHSILNPTHSAITQMALMSF